MGTEKKGHAWRHCNMRVLAARVLYLGLGVFVGARAEKDLHDLLVAVRRGKVERGPFVLQRERERPQENGAKSTQRSREKRKEETKNNAERSTLYPTPQGKQSKEIQGGIKAGRRGGDTAKT